MTVPSTCDESRFATVSYPNPQNSQREKSTNAVGFRLPMVRAVTLELLIGSMQLRNALRTITEVRRGKCQVTLSGGYTQNPRQGILSVIEIYRQRDGLNIDLRDVSLVLPNCSFFQYSTGQINA
jgi:hypothetical protein